MRLRTLPCLLALALPYAALADGPAKDASDLTRQSNQQWLQHLPFEDRSDFDNARRGLLEAVEQPVVNANGKTVWDLQRYAFLKGEAPATVNPSLWRIAQLNTFAGLFKVSEGIYQVRGLDLANMTLIEGEHGLIVMDPLLSVETARAGLAMYFRHRPQRPVVAVIYTHPHVDHFGGVRGVIDEADVKAGKVQVIAPQGFFEHAVSENVLAGPAMKRRAQYMYGAPLPRGPRGQVDAGLGKGVPANATVSLIAPTRLIEQPFETLRIDGVDIEFQLTPGTEAPAEMNLWFPQFKALCMAENASHVQHNVLTLRGAQVRDAKVWAHYLDQSLLRYGEQAEVVFAQHHWPTWGGAAIRDYLADQRDIYAFIDSQTLRLINRGLGPTEIAAELTTLPPRLASKWYSRDYYGSLSHNVRAVYQRYMGFYDGNPATLNPLPPSEAGTHYVKALGGAERVLTLAREAYGSGDYRWVAELTRHLVFAQPDNSAARELQADALEQLGYQSENATWRNAYLTGAQELRNGVAPAASKGGSADDLVRALTPTLFFDYLGVRVDAAKAAEQDLTINWHFTDLNEDYALTLRNGQADVEVKMSKVTLDRIALKQTGFLKEATVGDIDISGERMKFMRFMAGLDEPDGRFNIVTP
ncbi:alkyl/aryl-sulfatase [Pseudomonas sp. CM27]|uniref:alkyl/aryl-sulfatase n=1 Tax=Pseudomonas sp. CM27 TaxID=2738452 RepID=UPI0015540F26|nr:alkyl sulfatase dimerization domain-containing protein [Pseudomonas sp. CM27]NQD75940.1 MBL fold metallo-hydrolase [Pseudomonas sp. CM27]